MRGAFLPISICGEWSIKRILLADLPVSAPRRAEWISLSMPPKVLIIDDLPLNVELLEQVLGPEGFQTCAAGNGALGFAVSRSEQPDLILLDVMMPGEHGFETCAKLKSDPLTADIPVIFLSTLDDVKSKVKGLKIGGVDFVSKPVHGEQVLARVRVHLRIGENNRVMARAHQARLEDSRNAQQAILVRPEDAPGASFAVFYAPLEGAGGDFYDVVTVDSDVFGYFAADVSGLERLVEACIPHRGDPLKEAASRIAGDIKSGMARVSDDLLLLAIEVPA
jgi:CheY-like chemotaxis protein